MTDKYWRRCMKMRLVVLIIFSYLFIPCISNAASYILNDEETLYLGGYQIETYMYEIGKVIEDSMDRKIFIIKDKNIKEFLATPDSIYLYELSNKGFIAVSTSRKDEQIRGYVKQLYIYDVNGNKIKKIEEVPVKKEAYFSWSPDGDKIAYIKGKTIIEGRRDFVPSGVWIYDVESDKVQKIADKGVQIFWAKHDNNIYIQNQFDRDDPTDISVYDTKKGELSKSDKKGIIFSDDGNYYIGTEISGIEGEGTLYDHFVFDGKSNEKIYKFKDEDGTPNEYYEDHKFISATHYLVFWSRRSYKIFDIETKSFINKAKLKGLVGWNADMTKAIVYERGDKIHIDEMLTGKRLKTLDLPK